MKAIRVLSVRVFCWSTATTDYRSNAGWVFVKFFGKVQPLCTRALRGLRNE